MDYEDNAIPEEHTTVSQAIKALESILKEFGDIPLVSVGFDEDGPFVDFAFEFGLVDMPESMDPRAPVHRLAGILPGFEDLELPPQPHLKVVRDDEK